MKIQEIKKDGLEVHFEVIIPSDEINDQITAELSDIAKKTRIDGFRPGKAPLSIISKKYKSSVKSDVIQKKVSASINDIIKNADLKIATEPQINDFKSEDGQDISFKVIIETMPLVYTPELNKISIEKPILDITDDLIEKELKNLAKTNTIYEKEVKTQAKKDHQVTINADGYLDGEKFKEGTVKDYKLVLGSGAFVDNFEDQLIDHKAGDDIVVNITFPEQYVKHLAGKNAEFKVHIIAVHKPEIPEINDEFAKKLKFDDLESLKTHITETLTLNANSQSYSMMKMRFFDQLEDILLFDVPKSMIKQEYDALQHNLKHLNNDNVDQNKEQDDFYKKVALRRVRIGLMLAEYIKSTKLTVGHNEIRDAIIAHAKKFPGQEQAIMEYYQKNPKAIEPIKGSILEEKAVMHIFDKVIKISEKKYNDKQFNKLLEQQDDTII